MKCRLLLSAITFSILVTSLAQAKTTTYATFEGGGMLGYIIARTLEEAEGITQRPFYTYIDGGIKDAVSTGAILTSVLATDIKGGQPYTAKEAVGFYVDEGPKIFAGGMNFFASHAQRVAPFKSILAEKLGNKTLLDTLVPVSIHSYSVTGETFYSFDSTEIRNKKHPNLFMRDAVLASSSVSLLFGTAQVDFLDEILPNSPASILFGKGKARLEEGTKHTFKDPGEVGVCDTTRNAFAQIAKATPENDNAVIFSFGTGFSVCDFSNLQAPNVELVRIQPDISKILEDPSIKGAYQLAALFNQVPQNWNQRTGLANFASALATPKLMEEAIATVLGSPGYERMLELMLQKNSE